MTDISSAVEPTPHDQPNNQSTDAQSQGFNWRDLALDGKYGFVATAIMGVALGVNVVNNHLEGKVNPVVEGIKEDRRLDKIVRGDTQEAANLVDGSQEATERFEAMKQFIAEVDAKRQNRRESKIVQDTADRLADRIENERKGRQPSTKIPHIR